MSTTLQGHPNAELLTSATKGFDYLFSNDIVSARSHFQKRDDPFHLMGTGICAFLEAALGMESGLMTEATRCLALSEAGTRKHMRTPKPRDMSHHSRFHHGLEWEILNADAVVLLGLTHALSESYMGYLQCMYALNSAHSKFTKLYKTVFPAGLPESPNYDPTSIVSLSPSTSRVAISPSLPTHLAHKSGFFSRWVGTSSTPSLPLQTEDHRVIPDGPVEDLIVAGTAFGFGLFNLVFSLLPKKVQGLVGFLGFKHDRKLALQALALSAEKEDVHGVFAGLVLMTYHGVVLLLSGYQADEHRILAQYKAIVDKIETRYPSGALWILNRAKIMRMSYNAEGAILVMQEGLKPNRPHSFAQADMLLIFELAWTLLGQRRYQEAADTFIKITEMNSWSHGTYYFIAAGCHTALGNYEKAQAMLDAIPDLIEKKKISGKDLPTEVFIKKKLAFYKEKQLRRGGDERMYVQSVKISPAEGVFFWNTHARIDPSIAQAHIDILTALTPLPSNHRISLEVSSPSLTTPKSARTRAPVPPSPLTTFSMSSLRLEDDLDTPDELAIRALLLGINYRTLKMYEVARGYLVEAGSYQSAVKVSTWVGGLAMFELAVLDLKEIEETGLLSGPVSEDERRGMWSDVLRAASAKLEQALGLATNNVDLSSRLDSRIAMLRDEIATKREMLGIII
ncbi:mitochondrial outer membrane protein IML2 [Crassisporium funariophilum]|nr:mitochondrial outer membrane protein IML2 [Crassisporium funariophilum]